MPTFDEFMTQLAAKSPDMYQMVNRFEGWGAVLHSAAEQGWTNEQTQGWLHGTRYWQDTSDTARQWDTLSITDPATARQRLDDIVLSVNDVSTSMGYDFSNPEEYLGFINTAARENWNQEKVRREVAGHILYRGTWGVPGAAEYINQMVAQRPDAFGALITGVSQLAGDYGVPVSSGQLFTHAANLLGGIETEDGVTQEIRNWAKGWYSGNEQVIGIIDSGVSLKQYSDPFMQLATNEVEINPNSWSLMDDKWRKSIDFTDPNGVRRPMTLSEWTTHLRNDSEYGYDRTATGQKQAATLTGALAQQFGAMG